MNIDIEKNFGSGKWFEPEPTALILAKEISGWEKSGWVLTKQELDVVWTREINAMARIRYNDETIDELSHFGDYYRFAESIPEAVGQAKSAAARFDIPEDEIRFHVDVIAWATDRPATAILGEYLGKTWFAPVPDRVWFDAPEVEDGARFDFKSFPYEVRQSLCAIEHPVTSVWSTLRSPEENEASITEYLRSVDTQSKGWTHPREILPQEPSEE